MLRAAGAIDATCDRGIFSPGEVAVVLSMTGFGEARRQNDRLTVVAEVRTVNNRHLKVAARISEPYGALEPDFERLVRETVRRGTVQLSVRVDRPRRAEDYRLNTVALSSYRDQIATLIGHSMPAAELTSLLNLPGVVEELRSPIDDPHDDWPMLSEVVGEALAKLQRSRADEGRAMATELRSMGQAMSRQIDAIEARGPSVVSSYHERLLDRVQTLLSGKGVAVEAKDLIREVALLAERADIAEEIIRLRAHLKQYLEILEAPESAGRKLEFVVQEMGRETNTIGSKANDVEISRATVEIKGTLEKIRELIQNIE